MGVEEALELAERLSGRRLKELEILIFEESWKGREGKIYQEIADTYPCTVGHVNDAASDLWKLLSAALGETVRKNTFRRVLEKRWRAHPEKLPQTQEPDSGETVFEDTDFVGREGAIADLKTFVTQGVKIIGIYCKGGVGKTTLAQRYFETQRFKVLTLQIAMETEAITPVEKWIRRWLSQDFKEEPEQDFSIMLDQLREKLQSHRVGVLIDNLEPALDEKGKFIEAHRRSVELLRIAVDEAVHRCSPCFGA